MLIAVDIGNSRMKFGLFERHSPQGASIPELPVCLRSLAIRLEQPLPWDELTRWAAAAPVAISQVIVAAVNPRGVEALLAGWPQTGWPEPRLLRRPEELPLKIDVAAPERVGIDRLLNAVAGNILRPPGQALVIIDSGTATTVDYVSDSGVFEGGAILPGFELSARALHAYTALLPLISTEDLAMNPPPALGNSTRAALQSGIFWGQIGAIKEIASRLSAGAGGDPLILLTGGAAPLLEPHLTPPPRHEPRLALQGLALAAKYDSHGQQ